jgi:hypothetical protein
MEPDPLLPSSQEISTGPHPRPDDSNPHSYIQSLSDSSECYPFIYVLVFLVLTIRAMCYILYDAPRYAAFSTLPSLHHSLVQIFSTGAYQSIQGCTV